jgi:hypothetical protein
MAVGKLLRLGLPFSNVVATGVATASVTPGRTIHRIILKLGGTSLTKAMLTLIKVKANGKVVFEGTGSQIDKLMTYRGITANAAYLTLDFSEIRGRHRRRSSTISSSPADRTHPSPAPTRSSSPPGTKCGSPRA